MPTLMIVDDESDVREFATNFFKRRKIDVISASNGEDALSLIEKSMPDLVLLDIQMAGIDGIETLRRIKEKYSALNVIMVTGKRPEEEGAFDKCKELGASKYIHKPLELDELERIVINEIKR